MEVNYLYVIYQLLSFYVMLYSALQITIFA